MALEDYKRKRDFTRSPEPSGDEPRPQRGRGQDLFFCVQKHLASHLHYDFRLEWKGVLLSWAVPKGPSLNPRDKRLAMHVEDHPLDYGEFEGVIPEGYGAGIVMLWDRGTWTPEVEDVEAALRKGDLKFQLDGFKLKGSWALIRTRGYGGDRGEGRSWLLIKHRDDWAGDVDITTFAPRSVKSDHDLPEILAAEDPDVWRTNRPVMGGATGAVLKAIVEQAAAIKAARAGAAKAPVAPRRSRAAQSATGGAAPAASRPRRAANPPARPASSRRSPKRKTKR
jgi:bifunctional non-homologous end joining protein LigD